MFQGLDKFQWFVGVVEDRFDPMMLGRVRVRVVGLHTDIKVKSDTIGIPTEELPWMHPITPITSAAMNGIGETPLGPVEGTHVVGFFKDPGMQDGYVFGTIGGISQKPAGESGFNDPNKVFPRTALTDDKLVFYPDYAEELPKLPSNFVGEPDTNRLARASIDKAVPISWKDASGNPTATNYVENISTYTDLTRDLKVKLAFQESEDPGGSFSTIPADAAEKYPEMTWDQPPSGWATGGAYPYNHVTESEHGHVFEVDDTLGGERLHWWHRRGTFTEIQQDGRRVVKVANDDYEIVLGDKNIHIKADKELAKGGSLNITVDGTCNMRVEGDYNLDVNGDMIWDISGNWHTVVGGMVSHIIMMTFTQVSALPNITIAPRIDLNP